MHSLSRAQLVQSGRLSLQMPADTIVTDRARAANSFIMSEAPRPAAIEGLLAALARVKITEQNFCFLGPVSK